MNDETMEEIKENAKPIIVMLALVCVVFAVCFVVTAGCMGISAPVLPQNMMKADAPVQPNPNVYVVPNYQPTPAGTIQQVPTAAANITITTTVFPTPTPKFRYVEV